MKRISLLMLLLAVMAVPAMSQVPITMQAGGFFQIGQPTVFAKGGSLGVEGILGGVGIDLVGLQAERGTDELVFAKGFLEYQFELYPNFYVGLSPLGAWWQIKTDEGDAQFEAQAVSVGWKWDMLDFTFAAELRGEYANVTGKGDMYFAGLGLSGYIK